MISSEQETLSSSSDLYSEVLNRATDGWWLVGRKALVSYVVGDNKRTCALDAGSHAERKSSNGLCDVSLKKGESSGL